MYTVCVCIYIYTHTPYILYRSIGLLMVHYIG